MNYPAGWDTVPDYEQNSTTYYYSIDDTHYQSPFEGCTALTSIVIPEGITAVPAYAFRNASGMQTADLPSTLETIGNCAFASCKGLTEITLPESVKTVGRYAFASCTGLTEAVLPEGLTTVSPYAFGWCAALESIQLPASITTISEYMFTGCTSLTRVTLAEGLARIGKGAFYECVSLESLYLPNTVTTIGAFAFQNCSKLAELNFPASWTTVETEGYWGESALFAGTSLKTMQIPEGVTVIPAHAFQDSPQFTEITLPSTVTTIGYRAFYNNVNNNAGLVSITLPEGLLEIGQSAFSGNVNLTSIHLPDSVTTIGAFAFQNCSKLSEINYPMSWSTVNAYGYWKEAAIFSGTSLETIVIPDGVTSIPDRAFQDCGFTHFELPSTIQEIGYRSFFGNHVLTSMILNDGLLYIGVEAFSKCELLPEIYIWPSVISIGDSAFSECSELTIYCEWATTALSYAKNNIIPYYYLSLTSYQTLAGANIPSGTLYKGDTFLLRGFVRSSVLVNNVIARITSSDFTTTLQEVILDPEVTDCNLSHAVCPYLDFAKLELGTYGFVLEATAGEKTETLAHTVFTIVPPPLRVISIGANVPRQACSADFAFAGMLRANYPITNVNARIYNVLTEAVMSSYSSTPNTTTFDLSTLNNSMNVSGLSAGDYQFLLSVTGNGETKLVYDLYFSIGIYDLEINPDKIRAIIAFAADNNNRAIFSDYYDHNDYLANLDAWDVFIMSWKNKNDILIDKARSLFEENGQSRRMIDSYKDEILGVIKEVDANIDMTFTDTSTWREALDDIKSTYSIIIGNVLGNEDNFFSEEMATFYGDFNDILGDLLDAGIDIPSFVDAATETISFCLQNYENSMIILEVYGKSIASATYQEEFDTALKELAEDFRSDYMKILRTSVSDVIDHMFDEFYKDSIKKLAGLFGSGCSSLYGIVTFSMDLAMQETGNTAIAEADTDFLVQLDTYTAALHSYHDAFDAVQNGDTSEYALNKLEITFRMAQQAGVRIYESMINMNPPYSEEANRLINKQERLKILQTNTPF